MFYQEYRPSSLLSPIVDKYWVSTQFGQTFRQYIIPEICTNIVFRLNGFSGSANIVGISTQASQFAPHHDDYYFGISFHPGILGHLIHEDFSNLTNNYISLDTVLPAFGPVFLEQLHQYPTHEERIRFVEKEITPLITTLDRVPIITTLMAQELQKNHILTTHQLAIKCNFSERQLQRKFKKEIGVSMKMFSRLVRFNKTYTQLLNTSESLQDLSFNFGYYDPAHLINEVKYFSGKAPSFFR